MDTPNPEHEINAPETDAPDTDAPDTETPEPVATGRYTRLRRITGVSLIGLCGLGWLTVAAVPFLGLSVGGIAASMVGLGIAAEVAFFLGILLLGKEIIQKFKSLLKSMLVKPQDD
jgi:hypothetical protein